MIEQIFYYRQIAFNPVPVQWDEIPRYKVVVIKTNNN